MRVIRTQATWLLVLLIAAMSFASNGCSRNELIEKTKKTEPITSYDIVQDVLAKIKASEFLEVEEFFDYLVKKKPYSNNGSRLLEEVYNYLSRRREIIEPLNTWCSSEHPHHSAFVLRGMYYIHHAWRARGTGYGYTVTDEARRLFRDRLFEAKKDLERAYFLNPLDPNSAGQMIILCMALGFEEETMEEWFQNAIESDRCAVLPFTAKLEYLTPKWRGSHEKAARFANECLRSPPNSGIIYTVAYDYIMEVAKITKQPKAFLAKKQIKEILTAIFDRWLAEFPKSTSARVSQALVWHYLDDDKEATKLCTQALEIDPNCPEALRLRAKVSWTSAEKVGHEPAEKDFRRLIENDPYDDDAFYMLGFIAFAQRRNAKEAVAYYDRAIVLNPRKTKYFFWRGRAHQARGNYEAAIQNYTATIEIDERYEQAYWERGGCYRSLRENEKAQKDFETANMLHQKEVLKKFHAAIALGDAQQFVQKPGSLNLAGLTSITLEEAELLGKRKGILDLSGLKEITQEIAERLSEHAGLMRLNGLISITPEVAAHLSRHKGGLYLNGIKSITAEVAELLGSHKEGDLCLDGLVSLTPEVARHLSRHGGRLTLSGVSSITPQVAVHLGHHEGPLELSGLRHITAAAAKHLSNQANGLLDLGGLASISPDIARYLGKHKGPLTLSGVKSMSPESAKYLSMNQGALDLGGLEEITPEVAYHLSQFKGMLDLSGLKSITPEVAEHLSTHTTNTSLDLGGLKEITPKVAEFLCRHKGQLILSGLRSITPEVASHLGAHGGYLSLRGLRKITPEVAKYLSEHSGRYLDLSGLREASPEVVALLKQHKGQVSLPTYR